MAISNPQVQEAFDEYELALMKALDHLKSEFLSIRAGRANPQILHKIVVDYYGTPTPLQQMATITVPEARMLVISLYDASMLKSAVKAINESDIGIHPTDDGKTIRLVFPQLTEERRRDLGKQVKKTGEETKVVLRNERRDTMDVLKKYKKDNVITEDELACYEKDVQKMLDKYIDSVDKAIKDKEAEILEI